MNLKIPWELFILASIILFITIFFVPVPFSPVGKAIYFDAPIAMYHFDEGSGTVVYDSSDYGNNGTVHGAGWVAGYDGTGYALSFDGINDYVSVYGSTGLNLLQGEGTISAWVYTLDSTTAYDQRFVTMGENDFWIGTSAEGPNSRIMLRGWNSVEGNVDVFSNKTLSLYVGAWHHVAGVADGSNLKLYIDGVLQ
ncbi:LamG domain-containing protein, partial [Candidatus Micrarchaeota archaeon]|nr:LamG domain-containing protein [Candidatus Micrarchaeota archaeon]